MSSLSGPADGSSREELSGSVERVTYHDPDSGFCVLQVGQGSRTVTVVGRAHAVVAGEIVFARGSWTTDREYGRQFRAVELRTATPDTPEGIERYLGSGVIKGVGKVMAKRLVEKFGKEVLHVIETSPKKLRKVSGIGMARADTISRAWEEQKGVRDVMLFLYSHGVGSVRASQIFKKYGGRSIETISENPYRLIDDIRGVGFRSADSIAKSLGLDPLSMARVRAGISFALAEAADAGHCAYPREELLTSVEKLLEVPRNLAEEGLQLELESNRVVADSIRGVATVALAQLAAAEKLVAQRARMLLAAPVSWNEIDTAKAIPWVEKKLRVALAESQKAALTTALASKVSIITGGPGVGKTTLIRSLVTILGAKEVEIALAAPTGRAAKRLSESTGREAKTIHRLLEIDPGSGMFGRNEMNPLECDLLVVDESSMIDILLMRGLIRAIPHEASLVLVGDVDQLPSVGPGQVLDDFIRSGAVPVVRLTEVFRQAAESRIIATAHQVNSGAMPDLRASEGDFYFMEGREPDEVMRKLVKVITERIPQKFGFDARRDVQVLVPMNRGAVGTRTINDALQRVLNPGESAFVEYLGVRYSVGDKIMQTENDYDKEVYNGDIGFVRHIDREEKTLVVEFDGRRVEYGFDELESLQLAYAISIHKSQGSEYPAVVLVITRHHFPMLQRKLLYTGITRGKRLVVIIGEARSVETAVRNRDHRVRWSKLGELLAGARVDAGE